MLIVTNIDAVNAAFAGSAPRPIEEQIREIYPDATIDCNGRAHAPYDGFECPITNAIFRAGEYLPFERDDDDVRLFGRARRFPEAIDHDGKQHAWNGTPAQNRAVWAELFAQTKAHDAAVSQYIGEVGTMIELRDLTIDFIAGYHGTFGYVFIYGMKDVAGNVIVYKGTKRFERTKGLIRPEAYQKGAKVSMRAKIKAHGERDGVKQTIIERPKLH